jgi:RNA 2',3'-cyclic 3'-phosphodiesterase
MRLFVAVDLPEAIKKEVAKVAKELPKGGVTLSKEDSHHITLQFFEDLGEEKLEGLKASLASVKTPPFNTCVMGMNYFAPDHIRVIFAGIKEGSKNLRSVYDQISDNLRKNGIPYEAERRYEPHITIARVKKARQDLLLEIIRRYSDYDFGSFTVNSILLKRSTPTPSGHVHETLYEVKL